jgi:protein ImuB
MPVRGDGPARARPPLLMDNPEPVEALAEVPDGPPRLVRWRSLALKIARADGPERLDGRLDGRPGRDGLRDYYRVETTEGRRLWLFRRGLADDPEGPAPQWFVHGLG